MAGLITTLHSNIDNILHETRMMDYFDQNNLEWDETLSPLRIGFHTDDPIRHGREFLPPPDGSPKAPPQILQKVSKPQPPMLCFSLRTTWLEALALIVCGQEQGVSAGFNDEARLMMSGYALHDAGLISANCTITCSLLPGELERYQLGNPPANAKAIDPVLLMYVDALKDATEPTLRRNLVSAIGWLMASGKVKVIELPPTSSRDAQREMVN